MAATEDLTTLVCLFHHRDLAHSVINDLSAAGVPESSISLIDSTGSDRAGSTDRFGGSTLDELEVPERDHEHLLQGVQNGGAIVAVSVLSKYVRTVEGIFADHQATKIDEAAATDRDLSTAPLAGAAAMTRESNPGETAIPIIEEELAVGKRAVDQGGVRVYRRVVEIPVEESVNLREERITVERRPTDRAVTQDDVALQGDHTIELKETAEEAVISKTARVVEEVRVGKDATERTQRIQDTVRRTEVEVEEIDPNRNDQRRA